MYYPEELVEEVRLRNDIVDVISQYVRLAKKGSTYFGLCPFHNEKTGSFSVSREKQMYYCFGSVSYTHLNLEKYNGAEANGREGKV